MINDQLSVSRLNLCHGELLTKPNQDSFGEGPFGYLTVQARPFAQPQFDLKSQYQYKAFFLRVYRGRYEPVARSQKQV